MANLILWNTLNIDHSAVRPVGPHQLATWLRSHGYTVKVIDFCSQLTTDQLIEITRKHIDAYTIAVGVSSTFWNKHESLSLSENRYPSGSTPGNTSQEPNWVVDARMKIEATYPTLQWLLGGANSFIMPLYHTWVRFHGHAEDALLKFMDEKTFSTSRNHELKLFDIKSLSTTFSLDCGITADEVLPIELSRGCQFKCTFCRYPLLGKKKNTYIRDYNLIEREFLDNYERFGTTRYFFLDDTVNESDEKIEALADIAQRLPFRLEWVGYNRLDLIGVKKHTIQQLQDSGLRSAFFGIESFHPNASKIVGKGWSGSHGKEFLLELKDKWKYNTTFHLSLIAGLPDEDARSLDQTQQWCIDNEMHSWRFACLSISKRPDAVWKSEFDLNYSKYGYQFLDKTNDSSWSNKYWTEDLAMIKSFELNTARQQYCKTTTYLLGEVASMGYSFDELITKYKHEINWIELRTKKDQFLTDYVHRQLGE